MERTNMKRNLLTIFICCLAALTLAFALVSCEDNNDNNNNSVNNINQKNNYFSDVQHNESDSLASSKYMNNNATQKDETFDLKSSTNYGGTKQLKESKRTSCPINNINNSVQSTSTFRKTEQSLKSTKQIKSIPIRKKPQNHKIVKIDIAEIKKHCFLQDVRDTYLRKTELNTRPHLPTMDPIEKEVYELTMKKTNKEPNLGDGNFLSMVDILTQPNKKREDRIHSRSPIRRSNVQTTTSTCDNHNNTNTNNNAFNQKTKYQNTYYSKQLHNETQNKIQKRK